MKKRVLSALMAVGLACSLVVTAFATADVSTTPAPTAAVESQNTETESSDPAAEADPTETPAETPAATQEPTPAPEESTPAPSEEPASSATPEPTAEPSAAPDDTVTATPTPTPEATTAPTPEATEEPAAAEPTAEPEATAEPAADNSADGIEYTAALEQDGQALNVIVTAPADAFGEDVSLVVAAIENTDETDAIAAELDESGVTYDGFAALDISFKNAAGEEVEPSAPVTVRIELPDSIVDSGIDLSTLAVQHLAEDADGNVTAVEQVASVADGSIALSEEAQAAMEAQAAENTADDAATTDEAAGVAPMMLAANNAQTDATAEAAAVAEFEVDGFSQFVLTYRNQKITVRVVDSNFEDIGEYDANFSEYEIRSTWTSTEEIASRIMEANGLSADSYTFDHAEIQRYYGQQSTINWIKYTNSGRNQGFRYSSSTNKPNSNNNGNALSGATVYFVFKVELQTVETVDSTAEGVHMYMFNYNIPAFSKTILAYGNGDTKDGNVSKITGDDGWPTLNAKVGNEDSPSFKNFFGNVKDAFDLSGDLTLSGETFWNGDRGQYNQKQYLNYTGQEVNHLFLLDKFEEDGTFYYSSFENFATLKNDGDNNFTVYDALGTPSSENQYYFKRGNYMPYNTLNTSSIPWRNLYSETGTPLKEGDLGYGDPVYALEEDPDFYFGMYVWADFYQPKEGQIESNNGDAEQKDMIFEFTGDDDMWVYIDGVLVLDLGGIHDAQSGSINFATGEVTWTDTPTSDYSHPDKYIQKSTLYEKYTDAEVADNFDWKGDTFADGSSHRIQIFYMERGDGASNLKMSFNLKTIPDGQLSVQKKVENYYASQLADTTFTMQVKVNGQAYANEEYSIFGTEKTGTTDSNGQFKLKHDQTAVFEKLTVNDEVEVSEVGSSDTPQGSEINTRYSVACAVTDSAGKPIDGSNVVDGVVTAKMPAYGSVNVTVTNTATFTRPLKLVKQFDGTVDNQAPENFEATYTLYEVTDSIDKEIGSVKYSELVEGEYIFWLDTGKKYKIVETFEDNDNNGSTNTLPWQSVTVSTNDPAIGTQASDGIVSLDVSDATDGDEIDTITLTNHYGETTGSITIIKNIYGLTEDEVEGWIMNETATERLRFDVDYFEQLDYLKSDEAGDDNFPDDWEDQKRDDWNLGDWTFDVQDTLDDVGFTVTGSWDDEVTGSNGNESINKDEVSHYTAISMEKKTSDAGETYFQYKMTLDEVDLNYWYRVWELHTDVPGYTLESTVAEYLNGQNDGSLENLLVVENMKNGNHDGKATAFKLDADAKDVTVEFTNRYTPDHNDLSITKDVSGIDVTEVAGVTFNFTVTAGNNVDSSKLKDVAFTLEGGSTQNVTFTPKDGTYSATVSVQGTGTVTILGLPTGTYTVEEETPEDLDEYYYTGNSLNENNRDVEVSADAAGQITVINNYEAYRTITVIKDVTGEMGDTSRFFDFTAKTGNEKIPQANIQTDDIATAQVVGDGEFKLKDNGSKMGQVEIIKVRQNETVTITEKSVANEGYTTSNTVEGDTSSVGNVATVTAAQLQEGNVTVRFTNYRPVVPPTGLESNHTTPYGLMVGAAGVAGAALVGSVVVRRRRRRQE